MIRLHGKTTYTILRASAVKSALMPQFSEDLTLEFEMSTSGLTLLQTSSDSAVKQSVYAWACRARIFTELIGAHVIHAIPRRQNLIIVSNGINASSTNWTRIQAYMDLVRKAYGDIMLVIRLPEAASTERLHTMCPHEDPHFSYEFYTASQIAEGTDIGVLAWKAELFELQERNTSTQTRYHQNHGKRMPARRTLKNLVIR
jgi:hypothetical protein